MLKHILIGFFISHIAAVVYEEKTKDALGNTFNKIDPVNFAWNKD